MLSIMTFKTYKVTQTLGFNQQESYSFCFADSE